MSGTAYANTIQTSTLDFYNEIELLYAYDYDNKEYQASYTYPETDTANASLQIFDRKRSIQIKAPAIYTKANAEKWAKRYWQMWAFGLQTANLSGSFGFVEGNTFDYTFSNTETRAVRTFKISKKDLIIGDKIEVVMKGHRIPEDWCQFWTLP